MTSLASRLFRTRRRVADSTQPPKTVAVTVPDAPRASLNDDDELDHIVYNAQDYERSQLARMVFIILIPTLTLVSLSVVIVVSSLARQSTSEYAHSDFTRSIQLAALINTLQVERGLTAMQLGRYRDLHLPGGAHLDDAGARRLADARRRVDANLAPIDERVRVSGDGAVQSVHGSLDPTVAAMELNAQTNLAALKAEHNVLGSTVSVGDDCNQSQA